jgi:predicted transcriptional regulator
VEAYPPTIGPIIFLVIDIAKSGGVKKTKMMNMVNLSHKQLKEHLMILDDKDLIDYDIETEKFKTTEKGIRYLPLYNEIDDMTI